MCYSLPIPGDMITELKVSNFVQSYQKLLLDFKQMQPCCSASSKATLLKQIPTRSLCKMKFLDWLGGTVEIPPCLDWLEVSSTVWSGPASLNGPGGVKENRNVLLKQVFC